MLKLKNSRVINIHLHTVSLRQFPIRACSERIKDHQKRKDPSLIRLLEQHIEGFPWIIKTRLFSSNTQLIKR